MSPRTTELLLIDDDVALREQLAKILRKVGYLVLQANTVHEGLSILTEKEIACAIVDHYMPEQTGMDFLLQLQERGHDCSVVMMSGQGSIPLAVEAMKRGAVDFLQKPVRLTELQTVIERLLSHRKIERENLHLKELIKKKQPHVELIGESTAMQEVYHLINRMGPTDKPVLIQGESGTGKELAARTLVASSHLAGEPLVTINCAALPEPLLESELFGHEKGAFTGAVSAKPGLFEIADGGTLFIDEIGELSLTLQPKLLRTLEDGSLRRVGSIKEQRVAVRVIAATNRNLSAEVKAGRFREDLFYRINVVQLLIPPLRERTVDIPALARHFLGRMATQPGLRSLGITEEALALLRSYDWPGNVRQLQSALFRAAVLCERDALTPDEFPQIAAAVGRRTDVVSNHNEGIGVALYEQDGNMRPLEEIEADVIRLAIGHYRGRMTEVARRLGIGRSTLYRKLADLGIESSAA